MAGFDIEAEVRDLAARRDIADAAQRYMRGLDRLDPALLRSAFHDDAQIDVGLFVGAPEPYTTFCMDLLSTMAATHHLLGQQRIEMTGKTSAQGECYFQAWHHATGETGEPRDFFVAGRYIDEYACHKNEWRILKRLLVTDWVTDVPANHGFFEQPEIHRGGRRGEDFSERRDWPTASLLKAAT